MAWESPAGVNPCWTPTDSTSQGRTETRGHHLGAMPLWLRGSMGSNEESPQKPGIRGLAALDAGRSGIDLQMESVAWIAVV
jgi:hypothetical protein